MAFFGFAFGEVEVPQVVVGGVVVRPCTERRFRLLPGLLQRLPVHCPEPVRRHAGERRGRADAHQPVVVPGRREEGVDGLRSDVSGQRHGGGSPDQGRGVRKGLDERRPFSVVRARPQEADQGGGDDLVTILLLQIGEHLRQPLPLPLPGRVDQPCRPEHRRLVIPRTPRADEVVRPRGVLVRVAQVAGVGRLVGDGRRRRRRQHGVVAPAHPGEFGHGHVAGDATASPRSPPGDGCGRRRSPPAPRGTGGTPCSRPRPSGNDTGRWRCGSACSSASRTSRTGSSASACRCSSPPGPGRPGRSPGPPGSRGRNGRRTAPPA